jgi:S1-C subfamily serine protease
MKKNLAALFGAGVVGGVVALVAGSAIGIGSSSTTTTVAGAPALGQSSLASAASGDQLSARQIYQKDAPGVVFISANVVQKSSDPFGFSQSQSGTATGSGFVISGKGYILTNFHVVNGATAITATFDDHKSVRATVVGRDESTDLALLKVDPAGLGLHVLKLGSSKNVQVGDPVLAIGNPFGLDRTLTTGVVSALQRQITAPNGFSISDVIQTDAAINPGNSGGPLINSAGEVIGINSQIETGGGSSGGNVGIGFAVPIDTAAKILPQLEKGQRVQRGWLGVESATVDSSLSMLKLGADHGALVQGVTANSPAKKAGLRGGNTPVTIAGNQMMVGGDIIIAVDGKEIRSADDLMAVVGGESPGTKIDLKVVRGKDTVTIPVTLGTRPSR